MVFGMLDLVFASKTQPWKVTTLFVPHTQDTTTDKKPIVPVLLMLKGPPNKWKVVDNKDFITLAYVMIFKSLKY